MMDRDFIIENEVKYPLRSESYTIYCSNVYGKYYNKLFSKYKELIDRCNTTYYGDNKIKINAKIMMYPRCTDKMFKEFLEEKRKIDILRKV